MPNLTDDLGTAKERCLNQFGTAVLVWCGKSSTESVKLYLSSTHGTPSESDVAPVSLHSTSSEAGLTDTPFKGGTSRKLLEGEGGEGGRSTKKYSRKGKLKEKKFMHAINPKKCSCYGLKKILTRNLVTNKNFCGSKISHPRPLSPP